MQTVRGRELAAACGFAIVLVVGSPLVGQVRASVASAFPGSFRLIIGAAIATALAGAILFASFRIRERRALRYAAIASAVLGAAACARTLRTGNVSVDLVEAFHFVEYGFLTLLFYLAWHPLRDGAAIALPLLAGLLVAILDESFQWFVPARVGELHDLVINAAAVICGLLFSVGVKPPAGAGRALQPGSPMRIGGLSAIVILTFALFFHAAFLGYDVRDARIGTFRSRYTAGELEAAGRVRADRWRRRPPLEAGLVSMEDQYLSEALWHVVRRNDAVSAGDHFAAWRENRILETFFAPVLDASSYAGRNGHRWPAEQRAALARLAEGDGRPYVSDAEPYPIYAWSKTVFWLAAALAIAVVMAAARGLQRAQT